MTAKLQEAAEPLAKYADRIGDLFADNCVICTNPTAEAGPGDITVGDLRRLREALHVDAGVVESDESYKASADLLSKR